jgi:site-specific DNA recombinase
LLHDRSRLMALMGRVDADVARSRLQAAAVLAEALNAASTERVVVIRRLVARVAVGTESIAIDVRTAAIWSGDVEQVEGESTTSLVVPVQLKRCGPAVRLIVRAPYAPKTDSPNPRLIALLAKAQRWFTSLASGRRDGVLSIAQEHRMASAEVTRVVCLAFLAPDIVERIVRGEQPLDLNIKRLFAIAPLPTDWAEQRRVLGFDP